MPAAWHLCPGHSSDLNRNISNHGATLLIFLRIHVPGDHRGRSNYLAAINIGRPTMLYVAFRSVVNTERALERQVPWFNNEKWNPLVSTIILLQRSRPYEYEWSQFTFFNFSLLLFPCSTAHGFSSRSSWPQKIRKIKEALVELRLEFNEANSAFRVFLPARLDVVWILFPVQMFYSSWRSPIPA